MGKANDNLIQLNLLGEASLFQGGRLVPLKRKNLALVAYLVRQDRAIPRSELTALLWPDVAPQKSQNNLRALLHRLPDSLKPCLDLDGQMIRFRTEDIRFDMRQFDETINFANQVYQDEQTLKKTVRDLLEKAIDLYRGPFLGDFYLDKQENFMAWLVQERHILQRRAFTSATQLFVHYFDQSNIKQATYFAQELLRIDPFDEDANMALMKLWSDHGEKERAIRHFQLFQKRLGEELNVSTGKKITSYYRELLNPQLVPQEHRVTSADFALLQVKNDRSQANHRLAHHKAIPHPISKLFGREQFLADLHREIIGTDNRLISLIGMGGIGKTQLAIAIAHLADKNFKDGVLFIPLQEVKRERFLDSIGEGEELGTEIANQLARETLAALNIQPSGSVPPFYQLIENIGRHELLLIYDNVEHLIEGAPFFTTLLHAAAEVTILVTSRIRLGEGHERIIPVPPLTASRPASNGDDFEPQKLREQGAVQLFIDRGNRLAVPLTLGETEIRQIQIICGLVGGVPLAIEQAASWVAHYSLDEIIREIEASYRFLKKSSLPKDDPHRSMRSVFEGSYQLLSLTERRALQGFTYFQTEFSREAALAVSGETISTLISLLNRSMLQQAGPGWYSLHPLIAQFLSEKLASDPLLDFPSFRQNYTHYFLGHFASFGTGSSLYTVSKEHLDQLQRIEGDLLQAWRWGIEDRTYERLNSCAVRLGDYFELTGNLSLGKELFDWSLHEVGYRASDPASINLSGRDKETAAGREQLIAQLLLRTGYFKIRYYQPNESERDLVTALELLDEEISPGIVFQGIYLLCQTYQGQNRPESIPKLLDQAHTILERIEDPYFHLLNEDQLVRYFILCGEHSQALHHARIGFNLSANFYFLHAHFARTMAYSMAMKGEIPEAVQFLNEFLNTLVTDSTHHPFQNVQLKFDCGRYLLWSGRYREGVDQIRVTIDHFLRLGLPPSELIFYLSMCILGEIADADSENRQVAAADLKEEVERILKQLEMAVLSTDKILAYAACAAVYSFDDQWHLADQFYSQFLNELKKLEQHPYIRDLQDCLLLASHYLFQKGEIGTLSGAIVHLQQIEKLNPLRQALLQQLVAKVEATTGQPFAFEPPALNQVEVIRWLLDQAHLQARDGSSVSTAG